MRLNGGGAQVLRPAVSIYGVRYEFSNKKKADGVCIPSPLILLPGMLPFVPFLQIRGDELYELERNEGRL